jgi:hypothetical protein
MTQDEIIEMPEYLNASYEGDDLYTGDQVRELVKLVAEREREAVIAKLVAAGIVSYDGTIIQKILVRGEA